MTIYDVLSKFREISYTERLKGAKFEKLMQRWLMADPIYSEMFTKVWMWADSPCVKTLGKTDLGIDLVALDDNGGYWAIQCKCYDDTVISKKDVDSFLSECGNEFYVDGKKKTFVGCMWISTTNKYGRNAEKAFENQSRIVKRVNLQRLDESQVDWELLVKGKNGKEALRRKASPRDYQVEIIESALNHFKNNERGTLVMACGTGKTLTSLFITQQMLNNKGLVLFLAPSIALVGQSLNSWFANSEKPIKAVCVCSDNSAGEMSYKDDDDYMQESLDDIPIRSCTNPSTVVEELSRYKDHDGLLICFSTYQSIDVVYEAQKILQKKNNGKFGTFDFVICDEAHRTASVKVSGEAETDFTKIHEGKYIKAKRRMYMTATPKVYNEGSKNKAVLKDDLLFSMDKEEYFGKQFYKLGFGSAVQKGLLTDYKVLVLTINEGQANTEFLNAYQAFIDSHNKGKSEEEQIHHLTPAQQSMILGSVSALSKQLMYANQDDFAEDEDMLKPMHTAIAFCDNVRRTRKTKEGVYVATEITQAFMDVPKVYKEFLQSDVNSQDFLEDMVNVKSTMVSGDMPTNERNENLRILRETFEPEEKQCNVVCNVNCLSEGVDVPALDAAIFLASKKSVITIVQSVGRVMRKFEGKKYGYIIIPVVIPMGADTKEELDKNERYQMVWNVLNALRSHDERLAAELSNHNYNHVKVVSTPSPRNYTKGKGSSKTTTNDGQISFPLDLEFVDKLYARMVDKVGERMYWEKWAGKIADISKNFKVRLRDLMDNGKYLSEINEFINDLQKNINPSVDQEQAIEFLVQQLITQPVFDALFPEYKFTTNNKVSKSIQKVLDLIKDEAFIQDRNILNDFYSEISLVCGTLRTVEQKQNTIKTLYNNFFKKAAEESAKKLGIVYTPIECVNFIIKSVDDILQKEFNVSLKDKGVNILDPFTGTGTFITQTLDYLWNIKKISKEDFEYKYLNEIHCNEIVLLAYYIADVNIESVYNGLIERQNYLTFNNICLTDTFQLAEKQLHAKLGNFFKENSIKINEQTKLPIRVIFSNPPYEQGSDNSNKNLKNMEYPTLDKRVAETYGLHSDATNNKSNNTYIKAFRWASDRIFEKEEGGIVAFISNGKWLDANSQSGMRHCFENEFSDIYVLNLRGDNNSGAWKTEGGKIFADGSKNGITITFLIKNPKKNTPKATIHYHDIGLSLTREQKLNLVKEIKSVCSDKFQDIILHPNKENDWINQRTDSYNQLIPIAPTKSFTKNKDCVFDAQSVGISSNRDLWVFQFSSKTLKSNLERMLKYYDKKKKEFNHNDIKKIDDIIKDDSLKDIKWTENLKKYASLNRTIKIEDSQQVVALYRPYCSKFLMYNPQLIERPSNWNKIIPTQNHNNLVILLSGTSHTKSFGCIMVNKFACLDAIEKSQCFPLYWYENQNDKSTETHQQLTLKGFSSYGFDDFGYRRHDGISDWFLTKVKDNYHLGNKNNDISKETIFYYIYGLLHSIDYRTRFENDLKKQLPRIPIVDDIEDFKKIYEAGKRLAYLHLNYEKIEPYKGVKVSIKENNKRDMLYYVKKMKFAKDDKTTIIYNDYITISNIPLEAYEYILNNNSAIKWIMECYAEQSGNAQTLSKSKECGIFHNANDWSLENKNPKYIFDLLLSVINVSVQTVEIVNGLPKLKFE